MRKLTALAPRAQTAVIDDVFENGNTNDYRFLAEKIGWLADPDKQATAVARLLGKQDRVIYQNLGMNLARLAPMAQGAFVEDVLKNGNTNDWGFLAENVLLLEEPKRQVTAVKGLLGKEDIDLRAELMRHERDHKLAPPSIAVLIDDATDNARNRGYWDIPESLLYNIDLISDPSMQTSVVKALLALYGDKPEVAIPSIVGIQLENLTPTAQSAFVSSLLAFDDMGAHLALAEEVGSLTDPETQIAAVTGLLEKQNAKVLEAIGERLADLVPPAQTAFIDAVVSSDDVEEYCLLAREIGAIANPDKQVDTLTFLLETEDAEVIAALIKQLPDDLAVRSAFVDAAFTSEDPHDCDVLAGEIGSLADHDKQTIVVEGLLLNKFPVVRLALVENFARLAPTTQPTVVADVIENGDTDDYRNLAEKIESLADPEKQKAAVEGLLAKEDAGVRRRLTERFASLTPTAQTVVVADVFEEGTKYDCRRLAERIESLADPEKQKAAVEGLLAKEDAGVRRRLTERFASLTPTAQIAIVDDVIENGNQDDYCRLAEVIESLADPDEQTTAIARLLAKQDMDIRPELIECLERLAPPAQTTVVADVIKNGDTNDWRFLAERLGSLADSDEQTTAVARLVDKQDAGIRLSLVGCFVGLAPAAKTAVVADVIENGNTTNYYRLAEVIGSLADPNEQSTAVARLLIMQNTDVRSALIECLAHLAPPAQTAVVKDVLESGTTDVRRDLAALRVNVT